MSPSVLPLSFSPIYVVDNAFSLTNEEIIHIFSLDEYKMDGGNYVSVRGNVLEDVKLARVKDLLTQYLNKYVSDVLELNNKFVMTNTWTTRNPIGTHHTKHSHPNSIISGVYYVNASSGDFVIETTPLFSKNFLFEYDIKNYNFINSGEWRIPVKTNQLIIFPSWMYHSVKTNEVDENRRILGFNTFVTGSLGNEKDLTQLQL